MKDLCAQELVSKGMFCNTNCNLAIGTSSFSKKDMNDIRIRKNVQSLGPPGTQALLIPYGRAKWGLADTAAADTNAVEMIVDFILEMVFNSVYV
jgi:hypothetical protein